jgi:hypothetical protein
LWARPDHIGHLTHARRGTRGHHFAIDADADRILEVSVRDLGDARGKGGGEERRLSRGRRLVEDGLEVFGEAHVEHLVGFVQDDDLDTGKPQALAPDVIEGAAGGGHHHIDTTLQLTQLGLHGGAAVDGHRDHAHGLAVLVHRLGHLHGEFARGHQDERAQPVRRGRGGGEDVQEGQREGRGLARARGRLAKHVAAGQQGRDGLALNRSGLFVAECRERGDDAGIEAESGESLGGIGGDGRF